jgi:LPXTG-motif cell wall-anchored protein
VDTQVGTIGATPIATADFTLTGCDNSWSGKEFTSADFTRPTINFGNVSLTSGQGYTVLFSGDAIAGTQPTGSVTPTEAPTLANTGGEANPWLWISGAVLVLLGALGIRKSSKLS